MLIPVGGLIEVLPNMKSQPKSEVKDKKIEAKPQVVGELQGNYLVNLKLRLEMVVNAEEALLVP